MEKQLSKEGHGFGRAEQPPTQSGHDASPVRASPGLLVRGAGFLKPARTLYPSKTGL